jgi:hypothetical protein
MVEHGLISHMPQKTTQKFISGIICTWSPWTTISCARIHFYQSSWWNQSLDIKKGHYNNQHSMTNKMVTNSCMPIINIYQDY